MKLKSLILILTGLLFFSCSKSPTFKTINVSSDSKFYSSELGDVIGTHSSSSEAVFRLADHGYEHYLVLSRSKTISRPENLFRKLAYGATSLRDAKVSSLVIGETQIVSQGETYQLGYNFSNDSDIILVNDTPTDKLPQTSFSDVSFEFTVGGTVYKGNFPEPVSLKNDNTTENFFFLDKNDQKTINWQPSPTPDDQLKFHIFHRSAANGTAILPEKVIRIDDTGSFNITPSLLAEYGKGDKISILLSRDVFLESDKLLIRGEEKQSWGSIEIIEG